MGCKVCGNPATVRSHLMPRAFVRDMLRGSDYVEEGSLHQTGSVYQQSGRWDPSILCERHEAALAEADDYGVRFCRRLFRKAELKYEGALWVVPNPRPELLVKFACACVWRRGVSLSGPPADLDLGPYEVRLRNLLFYADTSYNPALLVCRQNVTLEGEPLNEILMEPFRNPNYGKRGWQFSAGGFLFVLKLDERGRKQEVEALKVNGQNPAPVLNFPSKELVDVPGVIDIAVNMLRPTGQAPSTEWAPWRKARRQLTP